MISKSRSLSKWFKYLNKLGLLATCVRPGMILQWPFFHQTHLGLLMSSNKFASLIASCLKFFSRKLSVVGIAKGSKNPEYNQMSDCWNKRWLKKGELTVLIVI